MGIAHCQKSPRLLRRCLFGSKNGHPLHVLSFAKLRKIVGMRDVTKSVCCVRGLYDVGALSPSSEGCDRGIETNHWRVYCHL